MNHWNHAVQFLGNGNRGCPGTRRLSTDINHVCAGGDQFKGVLHPSYDYYFSHRDHFAEVAVRSTPAKDLFVSLVWTGYDPADKAATFRVLQNPLILWMWVGGGFFLLGSAVAYSRRDGDDSGGEG